MFDAGELNWHQIAIDTIIASLARMETPRHNCAAEIMTAVRAEKARRLANRDSRRHSTGTVAATKAQAFYETAP